MTMEHYERAVELIEESGDGDFEGPKPDDLIAKAEAALGVTFPPTYRRFLSEYGCGDIGGEEFYGLINDQFEGSSIPNAVWLVLNERSGASLPDRYVLVCAEGDGTYCAIDISRKTEQEENPIVHLGVDWSHLSVEADSFGAFLLARVQQAI